MLTNRRGHSMFRRSAACAFSPSGRRPAASAPHVSFKNHQNGSPPPPRPRAPDRLLRRTAGPSSAAAADTKRATVQLPAAGASCRQPAAGAPGASGRQPSSRAHHAPSGATRPDHAAPGTDHSSSGSHHAPSGPTRPDHAAPGTDHSSSGSHYAASGPDNSSSRPHHAAAVAAHGSTSRHASSPGHPAPRQGAHARPEHRPDSPSCGYTVSVPEESQDPRRRDVTSTLARAHRHTDDRHGGRERTRGRLRHGRGTGGRGPRRRPALSSSLLLLSLLSSLHVAAPFPLLFYFRVRCNLILPAP
ncbi:predicted GPI-anchored protein 58 [Phragmites australis]|uniref:predicted GPI-anchored protein 58 n=1 Tax=Phragmites australis TaxID=29695 RepID=UPI002D76512A|nr:predicted GPI-anchored protein 58 [Phragmites australis]